MPALSSTTTPMARASYGSAVSPSYSHRPAEIAVATSSRITEDVLELGEQLPPSGYRLFLGQLVPAVLSQPLFSLAAAKPEADVYMEHGKHGLDRLPIRVRRGSLSRIAGHGRWTFASWTDVAPG